MESEKHFAKRFQSVAIGTDVFETVQDHALFQAVKCDLLGIKIIFRFDLVKVVLDLFSCAFLVFGMDQKLNKEPPLHFKLAPS